MSTDSPEFWNETWAEAGATGSGSDDILADRVGFLTPKRALDIGCGLGGNAVWLAENGWSVTAVDYSSVAIEKPNNLATKRGVQVEFLVADASTYRPLESFELVISFFIQLFPEARAAMLGNMSRALTPGGTLLFVSHDRSGSLSGWSEEDKLSLTNAQEIVMELPGLEIEQALIWEERDSQLEIHEDEVSLGPRTTVVRAVRPAS